MDPDFYCPQAALVDEETHLRTERRLARYRARIKAARERQDRKTIYATMMASRQHQRLWMAGGAFAIAAALGLLWYERHSRRGRRRRGVGDPPGSRDLVLVDDDDDGLDEPDDELRQVFNEAASLARSTIPCGALDRRDQLMLYGLYKQSTEGDRKEGGAVSRLLMMVIVVIIHYLIIY